jgi:hypothetical protein
MTVMHNPLSRAFAGRRLCVSALAGMLALPLAGCRAPDATGPVAALAAIRTATERYKDVNAAIADGYARDVMDLCETPAHMGSIENLGAMGIHYLRGDLLGIQKDETRLDVTGTHADFSQPAGLIYEPQADKSLALVAIENVVSASAWAAAGHKQPPSLQDTPFRLRPENPGMQTKAQYELQVWLFRVNPSGMFAPYNPKVTCEHHEYDMPMIHPPIDLLPGEKGPAQPHH